MPRVRGRLLGYLVPLLVLPVALAATDSFEDDLARLRLMPLAYRRALNEKLVEFDQLPASERARIKSLDQAIKDQEPEARDRYLGVLKQYEMWYQMLDASERSRLAETPPEERLSVIRELLATRPVAVWQRIDDVAARASTLNQERIINQVHWIRIWFKLSPAQRDEVEKEKPEARVKRLEAFASEVGVADERPALLQLHEKEARKLLQTKRAFNNRGVETIKPQVLTQILGRASEARYLQNFKPEPIPPTNLERFVDELPAWLREPLDPLPPAAAWRRLVLLYRLSFPAPAEIPEASTKPENAQEKRTPEPPPDLGCSSSGKSRHYTFLSLFPRDDPTSR